MKYAHRPGPPFRRHLLRAVLSAGSLTEFQRALSRESGKEVYAARLWNWLNRDQVLPAEMVLPIERATGGQVKRHELRPDLYPEASA